MKILNNFKKGEGFSLIEMLIVLGLFVVLGLLITNVFLLSLKAQQHASSRQQAVSSLRFVMETIAQEIRTSEIDYSSPINNNVLNLISGAVPVQYSLNTGEIVLNINGQISTLNDRNEIIVTELHFYVDPPQDPFQEERCNDDDDCDGATGTCSISEPDNEFEAGFCFCDLIAPDHSTECVIVHNCVDKPPAAGGVEGICLPFDSQPRVTIAIAFTPVSLTGPDTSPIYMQTTISSRIYKR